MSTTAQTCLPLATDPPTPLASLDPAARPTAEAIELPTPTAVDVPAALPIDSSDGDAPTAIALADVQGWIEDYGQQSDELDVLRGERDRLKAAVKGIYEAFLCESLNGVVCSIPDGGVASPVSRNYCERCRNRWRQLAELAAVEA